MKAKLIGKGFVQRIARKDESVMLIGINNKEEVRVINVCFSKLLHQILSSHLLNTSLIPSV